MLPEMVNDGQVKSKLTDAAGIVVYVGAGAEEEVEEADLEVEEEEEVEDDALELD